MAEKEFDWQTSKFKQSFYRLVKTHIANKFHWKEFLDPLTEDACSSVILKNMIGVLSISCFAKLLKSTELTFKSIKITERRNDELDLLIVQGEPEFQLPDDLMQYEDNFKTILPNELNEKSRERIMTLLIAYIYLHTSMESTSLGLNHNVFPTNVKILRQKSIDVLKLLFMLERYGDILSNINIGFDKLSSDEFSVDFILKPNKKSRARSVSERDDLK